MKASVTDLYFPEAVIFDDNGTDVLAVHTDTVGPHRILFRERALILGVLGKLTKTSSQERVQITGEENVKHKRLLEQGLLRKGSNPGPGVLFPQRLPWLNVVDCEIQGNIPSDILVQRVAELTQRLRSKYAQGTRIRFRMSGPGVPENADLVARNIQSLTEVSNSNGFPAELTLREISSPSIPSLETLKGLLDNDARLQFVLEDLIEVEPAHRNIAFRQTQFDNVRSLVKEGFDVRISIPSRCQSDLNPRVSQWSDFNEGCGVHVVPLVVDRYRGTTVEGLTTTDDFKSAGEVLRHIAEKFSFKLHRYQPWSSLLLNASTPLSIRQHWNKIENAAFLGADGKWARTALHADTGYHSALEELFSLENVDRKIPEYTTGLGASKSPNCPKCEFKLICDRYYSPEVELLVRTRDLTRAQRVAEFQCQLRMDVLNQLFDSWRIEEPSFEANRAQKVEFSHGKVQYSLD